MASDRFRDFRNELRSACCGNSGFPPDTLPICQLKPLKKNEDRFAMKTDHRVGERRLRRQSRCRHHHHHQRGGGRGIENSSNKPRIKEASLKRPKNSSPPRWPATQKLEELLKPDPVSSLLASNERTSGRSCLTEEPPRFLLRPRSPS